MVSVCRHTARFLILWLLLLPLALWGSCGWGMVPTIAVISFVLLGKWLVCSLGAAEHALDSFSDSLCLVLLVQFRLNRGMSEVQCNGCEQQRYVTAAEGFHSVYIY